MEIFQSTRPARGATKLFSLIPLFSLIFQSTRPARGATSAMVACHSLKVFQSTRPARGATEDDARLIVHHRDFNPRAPRGARLWSSASSGLAYNISIHAPREGRDFDVPERNLVDTNFNPRAPRGARPGDAVETLSRDKTFQSTRPARGATTIDGYIYSTRQISIHAPREGRD